MMIKSKYIELLKKSLIDYGNIINFHPEEKSLKENKSNKEKNLTDEINSIKNELEFFSIKPNYNENNELGENLKNLTKQLEQIKIQNIINDKTKNIIKDTKLSNFILRYQVLDELPSKELRNIVDQGKKEIKSGVLMAIPLAPKIFFPLASRLYPKP